MKNDSTVPERPGARVSGAPSAPVLGLVILWCPLEPKRVGAWLPVRDGKWIFGRGLSLAEDTHPRLPLFLQRPGVNVGLPPLGGHSLSRVQFVCHAEGAAVLHLENVGRCGLVVNGRDAIEKKPIHPGDVIEIGNQVAFLCTTRPVRLAGEPSQVHEFGAPDEHGIVGESPAIWQLRESIAFAGPRSFHVLVRGDSGTGKELVARALHALAHRKGPFVPRNAATLPESILDAELFGNAENYPNPGMRERKGLIGTADKGTLFLDEIAELPVSQQTHLLRVLDAGEYQRLGDATARKSDLRLVGATNRPLSALREDVLARFACTIDVPDLTERREDLPLLIRHLLQHFAAEDPALGARFFDNAGEPRISAALVRHLVRAPPSGNMRGLRNFLWRAIAQSPSEVVEAPPRLDEAEGPGPGVSDAERILATLNAHGGSVDKTWRELGLSSRFALTRLMKKYGIGLHKRATDRE
jgi:two-component system response regulator HydG